MNAAARAKAILVDPLAAWATIEGETDDPAFILSHYVARLALIPAVFGFAGACLIGVTVPGVGTVRTPLVNGVFGAIFGYVMACGTVLVLAIMINLLSPHFGGRRDFDTAFKLVVYSFTPVWLAGVFLLLPGLHFLALSGLYGAYLLWLGLPRLSKLPQQHVPSVVMLIVGAAAILVYVAAATQHVVFGTPGL